MSKSLVLCVVGLAALCLAHPQFRQLKCATPDGQLKGGANEARCHMIIKDLESEEPGRPAPEGDGCFTEIVNGEERVYCDLVCPKAHTVFNAHIEQGHRACFNFYTYQLERREQEWYIWRSGKCLNSTATFTVGCKFDEPFKTQFASDNEVFARLAARRVA
ncbi:hypothetical protein M3Y94_01196100 [Aphelenchoides besseyi]|nr:hypothetical protein M3Y94_01196100 [Aphelenchoides besseyi]KAI6228392.1 hypothetical protein M3Y95_00617600 [Aphelenchoides besseyi]